MGWVMSSSQRFEQNAMKHTRDCQQSHVYKLQNQAKCAKHPGKQHLQILESFDDVSLHRLGCRLRLENAFFLREGIDATALLASRLLLNDKSRHARDHELAALLELMGPDGIDGFEHSLAFLAVESGFGAHVVQQLRLGEVAALRRDGCESLLNGLLDCLCRGHFLAGFHLGFLDHHLLFGGFLDGLAGDTLGLFDGFAGSHDGNRWF